MDEKYPFALRAGTPVGEQYSISKAIGSGGCGITYLAYDKLNKVGVALKECFSDDLCVRGDDQKEVLNCKNSQEFENMRARFKEEAELLMHCKGITGAMPIYRVLEENNTCYYAMEYLEGQTLKDYLLSRESPLTVKETKELLRPIFLGLENLHQAGVLHRDISPDNIFVCKNGNVRLIDFGSARVNVQGRSRIVDFAKAGFAPIEEYDEEIRQGTWTDVYSLAATVYRCITGCIPMRVQERMAGGKILLPSEYGVEIEIYEEQALIQCLLIMPTNRTKTIREFRMQFYDEELIQTPAQEKISSASLIGLEGIYAGREIPIMQAMCLGRRQDVCKVLFPDGTPGVSGLHCEVSFDESNKRVKLKDLGSTYGTRLLNGQLIVAHHEVTLLEGEGFIVGDDQVFAIQFN